MQLIKLKESGPRYHERHHVWPVRQSKEFKERGNQVTNKQIVIVPKDIHRADGRKLLHARNESSIPECPRESLAQGVSDARKGLLESGYDVKETAEKLLEAIKKLKQDNPNFFDKK